MHTKLVLSTSIVVLLATAAAVNPSHATETSPADNIQVGPRPYYLIEDMDPGPLKDELQNCANGPFHKTEFSIGHRGAALQFPEHSRESYEAAARMGAGIIECDVTFTKDKELVCRHSQCDLHTTTNILATPLADKCSKPFTPAEIDPATGKVTKPASAECCTSDITLDEFKTLKAKMDAANTNATTIADYLKGTPNFRTDLYSAPGTLMTHKDSIALFKKLGVKMTPELKYPSVKMPFDGFTQEQYAQKMIDEYKAAGVPGCDVFPQSFELDDILYWIKHEPEFGQQAVYLDDEIYKANADESLDPVGYQNQIAAMPSLKAQGVNYISPPLFAMVELDANNDIVPSTYAKAAQAAGINMIAWTLERSYPMTTGGGWYYQTVNKGINKDGNILKMLDVLAQDVGIKGIFSDWPATVTYYANCKGL
ncbi:glycerophosphodiester phosphodiesterase family protein [Thiothrix nivea]|uniref:glycerophosphodiester phosphodiesterase n=1 Tax=Thiothrix nivea (strain ATCC 35100 / DSM 5205 / JP2) TaxID=870187 RepID=A0A656H9G8_THINJ|nr:glycerophosphodiester phosphodiesterase family protein [Thiothrix nivea]EIJ33521.1 glycerophosphoryl diester phosphodiesterase [Thiothrix nivea DSM 5205]